MSVDRVKSNRPSGISKRGIEIGRLDDALPEFAFAVARFELLRRHAEQGADAGIKIGKHPVGIQEQVRHR